MDKYKLYGTVGTGTCAIHAALEELGVPYELVEITTSEGHQNTGEYRKINPRQQVPSLVLPDGQSIVVHSILYKPIDHPLLSSFVIYCSSQSIVVLYAITPSEFAPLSMRP